MKCDACGKPAAAEATVAACEEHKRLVTGLLATLRPGEVGAEVHLSEARRLCLTKMQEMARELAEATYLFSSPDIPDEKFGAAFARVEALWTVMCGRTGGPHLRDLLH